MKMSKFPHRLLDEGDDNTSQPGKSLGTTTIGLHDWFAEMEDKLGFFLKNASRKMHILCLA